MTTEELLKPRIKVIAPAPFMKNEVGTLLYRHEGRGFSFGIITGDSENFFPLEVFKEWPHIFKEVPWWEDREIEDMPEYVKHCVNHRVFRVKIWRAEYGQLVAYEFLKDGGMKANWYKPSTKEEYKQYLKTKQQ